MSRVADENGKNFYQEIKNFDCLKNMEFESMGQRHVPIRHDICLEQFIDKCNMNNMEIIENTKRGLISGDNNRFYFSAFVKPMGEEMAENFKFIVGFEHANDESISYRGFCGYELKENHHFITRNAGIKAKHTKNGSSNIEDRTSEIVLDFISYRQKQFDVYKKIKNTFATENDLANLLLKFIRNKELSNTATNKIVELYDNATESSQITILDFQNILCKILENVKSPFKRLDSMQAFNEVFNI